MLGSPAKGRAPTGAQKFHRSKIEYNAVKSADERSEESVTCPSGMKWSEGVWLRTTERFI